MTAAAHAEIRTALLRSAKGLTARQLLDHCDSAADLNEVVKNVHALKGEGKIRADGMRDSQVVYKVADWPADGKSNGAVVEVIPSERPADHAPARTKHSITTLREGLFEMQAKLRLGQVDVQTAKTYAALSMTIIKSVEVQLDYERLRLEAKLPAELTDVALVPALEHKP